MSERFFNKIAPVHLFGPCTLNNFHEKFNPVRVRLFGPVSCTSIRQTRVCRIYQLFVKCMILHALGQNPAFHLEITRNLTFENMNFLKNEIFTT